MDELKIKLFKNFENLNPEFIYKLRENDSLIHFTKNFLVNQICNQYKLDFDYKEANNNFCKKNKIKNKTDLTNYLKLKGMLIDDHKRNLINSEKIFNFARENFSKKAEQSFIKNKNLLDIYSYEYVSTLDSDFAYEIYFQLESLEINFSDLRQKSLEEKTKISFDSIRSSNLIKVNSVFRENLIRLKVNEFTQPFKLNNEWLIIFLNEKKDVKFDKITMSKMVLALFDEWINILTIELATKSLN